MFYGDGVQIITSTQALVNNPSTASILAEVQGLAAQNYEARVICGASTLAAFWVEQCLSTGLGSTALQASKSQHLGRRTIFATVNQSAQYMFRFKAEANDLSRVRVRRDGSTWTGDAACTLQLEPMT